MSKKPIEQQVAELTPEQKNTICRIYKKYIITIVAICLVGVLVFAGLFVDASARYTEAKDRYDRLDLEIALCENDPLGLYGLGSLHEERWEALNAYSDAQLDKSEALMIGSGIVFVGVLAVAIFVKVKYPYFSEKKYTYLKKLQKDSVQ